VMHHSFKNGSLIPTSYSPDLEGKDKNLTIKRNNQNFQKLDFLLDPELDNINMIGVEVYTLF
jgi:hypothetical protein